ncbi:MAG: hypothetical protein JKY37_02475 [Nannocystaceae bacterium]|nr:hypothetical protein [Nannocystaceae bacterium]
MTRALTGLLGVVLTACTGSSPPQSKPTRAASPQTVAVSPDAPPPSGEQWACKSDSDCTMTCALGSVSAAWIKSNPDADNCDDGCGWSSGQEACRNGECVALAADGTINPDCTHRTESPY